MQGCRIQMSCFPPNMQHWACQRGEMTGEMGEKTWERNSDKDRGWLCTSDLRQVSCGRNRGVCRLESPGRGRKGIFAMSSDASLAARCAKVVRNGTNEMMSMLRRSQRRSGQLTKIPSIGLYPAAKIETLCGPHAFSGLSRSL